MGRGQLDAVVRHLRRLAGGPPIQCSDAQLLEQFVTHRDEEAFASLVRRHGGLIRTVCRHILHHEEDVDDALQATLLVLARKAGSIRKPSAVASWLYGVAYRIAMNAKKTTARRRWRERQATSRSPEQPVSEATLRELQAILDEELQRLPEKLRVPLILCCLEGKSKAGAAHELGWKEGTVSGRLAEARKRLQQRLLRRGVTLSAALCATGIFQETADAVPATVIHEVLSYTAGKTGAVSASAVALTKGVLKGMILTKLKLGLVMLLAVGAVAGGMGLAVHHAYPALTSASIKPERPQTGARRSQPAPQMDKGSAPVLAGTVVNSDGRPALGATVWVIGGAYESSAKIVTNQITDAQGRFAFPDVKLPDASTPRLRRPRLIARDKQGRIGWSQHFYPGYLPKLDVKLKLQEVSPCRARVVDATGQPITGAEIVPLYWDAASFREQRDPVDVPQELAVEYQTKTDAGGGFVLQSIPAQGGVIVRLRAAGFGSPWISFDSGQPVSIQLERAASVSGHLTGAEDRKAAAGVKLTIRRQLPSKPSNSATFQLIYFTDAMSQQDGTFRFEEVPPGRYVIQPDLGETLPYYAEPTAEFEIKPGSAVTGLAIPLRRAVPVRGRVLDKDSAAGIQDVSVIISNVDERGRLRYGATKTGRDGRYTAYVKPGKITVRADLQGYFSAQGREGSPTLDAGKPVDYPDLKLVRAARLTGVVADENGKPSPGAKVYRVVPNGRTGPSVSATSDGEGRFVFADIDPLENAPLRARTDTAVTAATTLITPENLAKPVRLVLSPTNASRLRGTVIDQAGRPVSGASVTIQWHFDLQSRRQPGISTSAGLERIRTDAQGRFETNALWPGETYWVSASADGYGKVDSTQVQAKAGQVHDLHNIVLQRTGGSLRGQIVNSKGLPIPGVLVFNNGDGPQPVQTQSDAAGRFRLEDLYQGGVFVCARKNGYRFTARHVETDGKEVTILLLRTDEPIPQPEKQPKPPSFEEQLQVARKLLEKAWALPMPVKRTGLRTLLESMARVDPEVAQRWAKEAGPRYENLVRTTLAGRLAETDSDEALTLLGQVDNTSAYYALKELTERYLQTDPAKALRFAEEAIVRARTREQPARTWSLAEIGSLVRQLGKEVTGRKLITEAADMADKLGAQDHQALARGMVAQALAPYDLERAQALLKPLTDPNDKLRFAMMVASAVMKDDPSLPPRVRMQIAYRMGATDPAAAVRIVDSIQGDAKTQAEAFAWVAVAVAPRDKKLAYSLIDRSLAIYVDESKEFQSWSNYGAPSVFAARVAGMAQKIGYPDMDSVLARVLAVRQTNRYESPARVTESHLATALILALTDPAAARQILRAIEPRNAVIGTGYSSIRRNFWLPAWALADLPHAVELFDRELAGLAMKDTINLQENGMVGMIEILTIPPPERARHLLRYYGAFWFPGEE